MGRPRAGHGFTIRNGVHLIADDHGEWVPSGVAAQWKRCVRCRRPTQHEFGDGLCNTCFYYKTGMTGEEFWKRERDEFFPYTIGRKISNAY